MRCCCGKIDIDLHCENASVDITRVHINETVHEVMGFRKDAFCGPQYSHDLRDKDDSIKEKDEETS